MNPIVLVAPEIDLNPAEMLYFDAGEVQGNATLILGSVSDPSNPATFIELAIYTPTGTMQTFSYDLTQLENPSEIRLAWKHQGGVMSFFSFDNVIITAAEAQTYWLLLDANPQDAGTVEGNGVYLPGEEITIKATANPNWEFVEWTDFDGAFISDEPEFVYVMPDFDMILVAQFETTVNISQPEINAVLVYPNPAGDQFNVTANELINQIDISDLTGNLVYQQYFNHRQVTIPTLEFRTGGLYFVLIHTASGTTMWKLTILK
jgi:hypothetical protein